MNDFNLKRTEELLKEYGLTVVKEMATYLVNTTNLKNDITSEVANAELTVRIPAHGLYVNDGRRPNSKMPPAKPIAEWMQAKGIDAKALYPIRRKIGKVGIQPRPFFHYFYDKLDILYLDIARSLGEEVVGILKDNIERAN